MNLSASNFQETISKYWEISKPHTRSQNSICTHLKPKPAHIPWPFHKKTPTIFKKATRVTFTIIITAE